MADVCLDAVWQVCRQQLAGRYGQPCHQDAERALAADRRLRPGHGQARRAGTQLQLGRGRAVRLQRGRERVQGASRRKARRPAPALTNHQFFNRLAEAFIAEVSRMTPEGALYRIDLRLRPEGDAGPLSRSLASYENYYAQWGQTWERMMLIKARGVAGDAHAGGRVPGDDPAVPLSALHQRERAARGRRHEGPHRERGGQGGRTGAQREARAGRHPRNRVRGAGAAAAARRPAAVPARRRRRCPCLAKLVQYELLSAEESRQLAEAYCFLRDVEHRLQMEDNLQTHTIPDRPARPGAPGPPDGLRDARRSSKPRARPTRSTCAGSSTGC